MRSRPAAGVSETYLEEHTAKGEGTERTRERFDDIAVESDCRWDEATEAGNDHEQVVPVETGVDGEAITVTYDEHS